MVKIKMCGLKRREEVIAAGDAGADAMGFVFYEPSSRNIEPTVAKDLVKVIPPFALSVGLFVDPSIEAVERVLQEVPLDLLQFHGEESAEFCQRFARPYIKAVKLSLEPSRKGAWLEPLRTAIEEHHSARGFLLDAAVTGKAGGTGEALNWTVLADALSAQEVQAALNHRRLIIAGGLTPDNVAECIERLAPYAVDVSSGIEAKPGEKSLAKIQAFSQSVYTPLGSERS